MSTSARTVRCDTFRWQGGSFRSCDACGLPFWEHSYRWKLGVNTPFGNDDGEKVPISEAERLRFKECYG